MEITAEAFLWHSEHGTTIAYTTGRVYQHTRRKTGNNHLNQNVMLTVTGSDVVTHHNCIATAINLVNA